MINNSENLACISVPQTHMYRIICSSLFPVTFNASKLNVFMTTLFYLHYFIEKNFGYSLLLHLILDTVPLIGCTELSMQVFFCLLALSVQVKAGTNEQLDQPSSNED